MIVLIGIQKCNKNMVNILLWSGFLSLFNYSQVILPSFQAALLLPTHPQKTLDIDLLLLSSYFFPAPDPLFRPLIQGFHLHLDLLLGFDRWPDIKKKATDWAKLNFSSQSRTWSPPLYWCNPPHFPLSFWGGDEKKKIIAFTSFLYSIWALNAVMSFLDDWFIPLLLESLHFSDIFSENTVGQKNSKLEFWRF